MNNYSSTLENYQIANSNSNLFSKGLPLPIPLTIQSNQRRNSISSDPKDYCFNNNHGYGQVLSYEREKYGNGNNESSEFNMVNNNNTFNNNYYNYNHHQIEVKDSYNHLNSFDQIRSNNSSSNSSSPTNSTTTTTDNTSNNSSSSENAFEIYSNSIAGNTIYNSRARSQLPPTQQQQFQFEALSDYRFPPKSSNSSNSNSIPKSLLSIPHQYHTTTKQTTLYSPFEQSTLESQSNFQSAGSGKNSLDYFNYQSGSNTSFNKNYYKEKNEQLSTAIDNLEEEWFTTINSTNKISPRSQPSANNSNTNTTTTNDLRRTSIGSLMNSPPQPSPRNYYHGGVGREFIRRNSLSDEIPTIQRKSSTSNISTSPNSKVFKPQILSTTTSPQTIVSKSPGRLRTRSIIPAVRSLSPSPPPSISKKRAKQNPSVPNSTRPIRKTKTTPTYAIQSNDDDSNDTGGAGSSKSARSFSQTEQDLLWNLWNSGEFYPTHSIVDQLVNKTTLNRGQIRGWFANRRFRASEDKKKVIKETRNAGIDLS